MGLLIEHYKERRKSSIYKPTKLEIVSYGTDSKGLMPILIGLDFKPTLDKCLVLKRRVKSFYKLK